MKLVREVIGTHEDVVLRAAQEAEETAERAIAAALYVMAVVCATRAAWLLFALAWRVAASVYHYWTERAHLERGKKRE